MNQRANKHHSRTTTIAFEVFAEDGFPHAEHAGHDGGSGDQNVGVDHHQHIRLVVHSYHFTTYDVITVAAQNVDDVAGNDASVDPRASQDALLVGATSRQRVLVQAVRLERLVDLSRRTACRSNLPS